MSDDAREKLRRLAALGEGTTPDLPVLAAWALEVMEEREWVMAALNAHYREERYSRVAAHQIERLARLLRGPWPADDKEVKP